MSSYWQQLCSASEAKPLQQLLDDLHAINGVLVACFLACAFAQAAAFARWRKWNRRGFSGWPLYGWFSVLSCLGSIAGSLAYGARLFNLSLIYSSRKLELLSNLTLSQSQSMNLERSGENLWAAVFYLLYPFELSFVISAQLLVLHRLQKLSVIGSSRQRVWSICRRVFLGAVITFNTIGALGNVVAAVYFIQSADLDSQAADAWASKSSAIASDYEDRARLRKSRAGVVAALQRFCEMIVLLLIITAFLLVGITSSRIITSALRKLTFIEKRTSSLAGISGTKSRQIIIQASAEGRLLQRKIVVTFIFVFATLLLRSVFSIMFAAALAFQDIGMGCARNVCDPCFNAYSHITFWILYTPAFQQSCMLIASPLSLLVSLWGMSGVQTLEEVPAEHGKLDAARQTFLNA